MRRRAEIVERSFAHTLDRGGMRRTWLRGCENVQKRYLVHVAGHNLGIPMRLLIGGRNPERDCCALAGLSALPLHRAGGGNHPFAASPDGFAIQAMAVLAEPA